MGKASEAERLWDAIVSSNMETIKDVLDKTDKEVKEICECEVHTVFAKSIQIRDRLNCIHLAAKRGNVLALVEMFNKMDGQKKINIERKSSIQGWTALHYAVFCGHASVVKVLLVKDAKINSTTKDTKTALHLAMNRGYRKMAALLIMKDIDLNKQDKHGITALHQCVEVDSLIKKSWTPQDRIEMVEYLLMRGAEPEIQDDNGNSALHLAIHNEIEEETILLLAGVMQRDGMVNVTNKKNQSPIDLCKDLNLREKLDNLSKEESKETTPEVTPKVSPVVTPVQTPVQIEVTPPPDSSNKLSEDDRHSTPSGTTIRSPTPVSESKKIESSPHTVDMNRPVNHGAAVLIKGKTVNSSIPNVEHTPLSLGRAITPYINHTTKVNSKIEDEGNTPMHNACKAVEPRQSDNGSTSVKGNLQCVKSILLQGTYNGGDINKRNKEGQTPLHIALTMGDIEMADFLVQHGANIHAMDLNGVTTKDLNPEWYERKIAESKTPPDKLRGPEVGAIVAVQNNYEQKPVAAKQGETEAPKREEPTHNEDIYPTSENPLMRGSYDDDVFVNGPSRHFIELSKAELAPLEPQLKYRESYTSRNQGNIHVNHDAMNKRLAKTESSNYKEALDINNVIKLIGGVAGLYGPGLYGRRDMTSHYGCSSITPRGSKAGTGADSSRQLPGETLTNDVQTGQPLGADQHPWNAGETNSKKAGASAGNKDLTGRGHPTLTHIEPAEGRYTTSGGEGEPAQPINSHNEGGRDDGVQDFNARETSNDEIPRRRPVKNEKVTHTGNAYPQEAVRCHGRPKPKQQESDSQDDISDLSLV